jgi:hypothetical protein
MMFSGWISVLGKAACVDTVFQKVVMAHLNGGFPEHQNFDDQAWVLWRERAHETLSLGNRIVPAVCQISGGSGRADWLGHA